MGFFDSLKEALGGDKDDDGSVTSASAPVDPALDPAPASAPASASDVAPASGDARHVDRDATDESTAAPHVIGGKHAQRD
ncbi:hypothetical protein ISU07_01245 [Nocardioides islandensis]|uniref:Uncharacterized protein n=1 Tax=Nocardioides islandensis TaxID=433663 RepID=A0A930VBT5_9ACTN|nr:hypothetical protein [Nocardioides islandensis]MBF4761737.1 hypothetical protein [Nocardioides islandensis]